jgi:nitroimidazol reductase NimA-like FMN-containing flavoprotein (pyridoxamine 5'-phosphate oxidase superfamily)
MSFAMTKEEREAFLADVHVGVISVAEDGHGPLTVPVWYSYEPGGEVRIITARALGGHLKTGQLWTGQNRPVGRQSQA